MVPNVELLEQTMRHIIDHPEKHDQRLWVSPCGTTACYAGWACILSGAKQTIGTTQIQFAGETRHPQYLAAELLGLDHATANNLFNCRNTIEQLELMVKDLVNGQDITHD